MPEEFEIGLEELIQSREEQDKQAREQINDLNRVNSQLRDDIFKLRSRWLVESGMIYTWPWRVRSYYSHLFSSPLELTLDSVQFVHQTLKYDFKYGSKLIYDNFTIRESGESSKKTLYLEFKTTNDFVEFVNKCANKDVIVGDVADLVKKAYAELAKYEKNVEKQDALLDKLRANTTLMDIPQIGDNK